LLWTLAQAAPIPPVAPSFPWYAWAAFAVFILLAMVVDLNVGKSGKAMTTKTALTWCAIWVSLALLFNAWIWYAYGAVYAEQFFAGYLLEYSLSVDNLFVFVLVFAFFRTPSELQHRALVWGIVGAMVLRAAMILLGAALIQQWKGVLVFFGVFLLYSGIMMLFHDEDEDPSEKWWVRFLEKRLPLTDGYRGDSFVVKEADSTGRVKTLFTRLFLVVLVIEASDVMFAVDSVPAIFGVTDIPFIVFTSNMFAILGLRSLYFGLSGAIQKLQYLNYGLSLILAFIGLKMILGEAPHAITSFCQWREMAVPGWVPAKGLHLTTAQSLGVIVGILAITIVLSIVLAPAEEEEPETSLSSSSAELRAYVEGDDAGDELGVPSDDGDAVGKPVGEAAEATPPKPAEAGASDPPPADTSGA